MLETADFYREILDNLYDGIFFINQEGHITYWNSCAASLTGYRQQEVINKNYRDIFSPLNKQGNRLYNQTDCPIRDAVKFELLTGEDAYIRHKEGHLVPISIKIAPVREKERHFVVAVESHKSNSPHHAMRQQLEELHGLAMLDSLTGVANRRFMDINLNARLEEHKRYGLPFAVMFMDVDNFKLLNDTCGHAEGDRALKMISSTISSNLRSSDIIGRWGGEEFITILINVSESELFGAVDRFRQLIEDSHLTIDGGSKLSTTVSIGATIARQEDTIHTLVERADKLMFESKRRGRNLVSVG
jgi:diguanylate cyclase (GGDEF)-like protein/PAS domain S-box-containing protein